MKTSLPAWGVLLLGVGAGCTPPPTSGVGFTLPKGDVQRGEATFVALHCHACHKVEGIEQMADEGALPQFSIALGGEVTRIQTYGELVTAIINPSHKLARGYLPDVVADDGQSKMENYNDVMTVKELTDVVTFLQSKYKLREIEPTYYSPYGY